jgi:transcriptional regulator with XRE-family HTH domain
MVSHTTPHPIGELWMQVRDHKKLARLMIVQEVSHRELAEVCGWKSHSYVGRILRGQIKTVDAEAALRIANHLQTPVDDLFATRVSSNAGHRGQKKGAAA